jgi:hypothetical protein
LDAVVPSSRARTAGEVVSSYCPADTERKKPSRKRPASKRLTGIIR